MLVRAFGGSSQDSCIGGVFIGVTNYGWDGAKVDTSPAIEGLAIDHKLQAEKSALVVLPRTVQGSGAGVVAGDAKHFQLIGLKVLAWTHFASGGQFGGALTLGEAGDRADLVSRLGGQGVEDLKVEPQVRAFAGSATGGEHSGGIIEAKVRDAV